LLSELVNQQKNLSFNLPTPNYAEVAFRAGAERLKRLFVSLAFVSRQRDVIAVEFDNDSPPR